MIRFTKREDYAIVLINKLVQDYNKRLVPLSEIAREYGISPLFLRNLASQLREEGIIKAVEGKNGGYFLQKNPKRLKVGEILSVFSKKPILECCPLIKSKKIKVKCPKIEFCEPGFAWRQFNKEFLERIYNLSFYDFIQKR